MKTIDAGAVLSRLMEKGIRDKPAIKEINKDIIKFLKDQNEQDPSQELKGLKKD